MRIAIFQASIQGFFPRFYKFLFNSVANSKDEIRLFSPMSSTNKRSILPNSYLYGTKFNWFIHYHMFKWLGIQDVFSIFSTLSLIRKLKKYKPDVINMHMSNSWVLNFPIFVRYVNKYKIPVVWTMHDCRAFTGRCAHFEDANCNKWLTGCGTCPLKTYYWPTIIDNSALQWRLRKKYLYNFNNLTIITPSKWLLNYVKQSPIVGRFNSLCIYNGVDIEKFSAPIKSDLRQKYDLGGSKVILGIAMQMNRLKGLDYFIELSKDLPANYKVVLVGGIAASDVDRVPSNIITLDRTSSTDELIAIYQTADVFVNPTLIDNFPTTNIEALAAGTPVVTFITGGSAESIDETSGLGVEKENYEELKAAIVEVITKKDTVYTRDNCIKRAQEFSLCQFDKYVELYKKVVG